MLFVFLSLFCARSAIGESVLLCILFVMLLEAVSSSACAAPLTMRQCCYFSVLCNRKLVSCRGLVWTLPCADRDEVPVPHFGVCLTVPDFHALAAKLTAARVIFVVEVCARGYEYVSV